MRRADLKDPNDPDWYLKIIPVEYSFDDRLWFWAMASAHSRLERSLQRLPFGNDTDPVIQGMISLGIYDWDKVERPFDASTRAMRYTAVLGDRLWSLAKKERERVSFFLSLVKQRLKEGFLGRSLGARGRGYLSSDGRRPECCKLIDWSLCRSGCSGRS